jgi:rare lipoprotein A
VTRALTLSLKSNVPRELPLEKEELLLFLFGCRITLVSMLLSKLKSLIAGFVILPGLALLGAQPAEASCGLASHYGVGDGYAWQTTANGEKMNPYAMTAAHPYLRLGSYVNVTHRGRTIRVKINDRGPYAGGRILDLSYGAFAALASPSRGEISVCIAQT